jgi:hypothetical protein
MPIIVKTTDYDRRPGTQVERVRGTQSLVHVIVRCWSQPGLLAQELAWRWFFGVPALVLLLMTARHLLTALATAGLSLTEVSLLDPSRSAGLLAAAYAAIAPQLARTALWLAPLLLGGWAAASGVGRAFVLRKLSTRVNLRPFPLMLLQWLRILALLASVWLWALLVRWAAMGSIVHLPLGAEPRPVSFAAWLICLSLGSFILWALWSWLLSLAAVLCVVEERGVLGSVAAAVRAGRLIPKLIEVNLVLGIVKLALIVLAMVFCSIPLPFEAVMSGMALYIWWSLVGLGYLAASDFFQVVRLAAFLQLREAQQLH